MPHITLEYSGNVLESARDRIDIPRVLVQLNLVLEETGGIQIANCKSRVKVAKEFVVGRGGPSQGFVHLDVRILEGRSGDLKEKLGARLLETLKEHFLVAAETLDLQMTVEIRDIERSNYFKHPEGTIGID